MLPKPDACRGCPFYGDGQGFVPDELVPGATVAVIGQNPGESEEREGRPFVGEAGRLLTEELLPAAGLERGQVSILNPIKCRWTEGGRKVNTLPRGPILDQALAHCRAAHFRLPSEVTVLVVCGELAVRATPPLAETVTSLHAWRGYALPLPAKRMGETKTSTRREALIVLHPAALLREPTQRWIARFDWAKVPRLLAGTWPEPMPYGVNLNSASEDEVRAVFETLRQAEFLVVDTEYDDRTGACWLVGLGGYRDGQVTVAQFWPDQPAQTPKDALLLSLREVLRGRRLVFQNAQADLPKLEAIFGLTLADVEGIDDTMVAHAVLWCELPHSLEFLDSIYGKHRKVKHLLETNPALYNVGDVLSTTYAWLALRTSLQQDKAALSVYRDQLMTALPVLMEATRRGVRIDRRAVAEVHTALMREADAAQAIAQAYVGWPINLGSDQQLIHYCYVTKGYPPQRNAQTKQLTVDQDAIAVLRAHVGPPFDPKARLTACPSGKDGELSIWQRIQDGADPVLEARVLYQATQHLVDTYTIGLAKGVYDAPSKAAERRRRMELKQAGGDLPPDTFVERVYPSHAMTVQKTARISTTHPPLATLPPALRRIVIPDPDEVWIKWDWAAIEPRILQAHSRSRVLKAAFDENHDLHTWTACRMFGYELPPNLVDPHSSPECADWRRKYNWQGKDDPRRVFAKQARYEMTYGGVGSNAAQSAARFGLKASELKRALERLLTSDPDYYRWRMKITEQVRRTWIIRDFMGAPRRLLDRGRSGGLSQAAIRAALDYPMQRGVSSIFYTTIKTMLERKLPVRFVWSMHDSMYWAVKRTDLTDALVAAVKAVAEQPYTIDGVVTRIPADLGIMTPPDHPQNGDERKEEGEPT